jgi:hypothetical protein
VLDLCPQLLTSGEVELDLHPRMLALEAGSQRTEDVTQRGGGEHGQRRPT